jgi:hypothetical protein
MLGYVAAESLLYEIDGVAIRSVFGRVRSFLLTIVAFAAGYRPGLPRRPAWTR